MMPSTTETPSKAIAWEHRKRGTFCGIDGQAMYVLGWTCCHKNAWVQVGMGVSESRAVMSQLCAWRAVGRSVALSLLSRMIACVGAHNPGRS